MTEKSDLAQLIIDGDAAGHLIPTILDFEYKDRKRELGGFLADLNNSGEIALLSDANLAAIRQLKHNDFWMVFGALSDAIEHLVDDYPLCSGLLNAWSKEQAAMGLLTHRLYHSCVGAKNIPRKPEKL